MGQQHYSPGQSEATERREVPPWVTAKRPNTALKGHYKIFVLRRLVRFALSGHLASCLCHTQGGAALCPGLIC